MLPGKCFSIYNCTYMAYMHLPNHRYPYKMFWCMQMCIYLSGVTTQDAFLLHELCGFTELVLPHKMRCMLFTTYRTFTRPALPNKIRFCYMNYVLFTELVLHHKMRCMFMYHISLIYLFSITAQDAFFWYMHYVHSHHRTCVTA